MKVHSTLRQRNSVITVAGKVISRRTAGDNYRPAREEKHSKAEEHSKTEEHPKAEVETNEDPNEDINEAIPEDVVMAEEQLSRGKKITSRRLKTTQ